jgi:two-component system, chemotaxis family, protein-glutamate methylesterase/glutaminase
VTRRSPRDVVVIGASAGGVSALQRLFNALPTDLPAVIATVLHRSPFYESMLAAVLGRVSALPVSEPMHEEPFRLGRIYVAPRDHHMLFQGTRFALNRGAKEHYTRPAVDPLFRSAAEWHGRRVIGVILTGSGDDGVSGLVRIKDAGGLSIAQDPDEAPHDSMPQHAISRDHVDAILTLSELAAHLPRLVAGAPVPAYPQMFRA